MASRKQAKADKLDAQLDAALAQTFPASDPFSVGQSTATEPPARPADRRAPTIDRGDATVRRRRKAAAAG